VVNGAGEFVIFHRSSNCLLPRSRWPSEGPRRGRAGRAGSGGFRAAGRERGSRRLLGVEAGCNIPPRIRPTGRGPGMASPVEAGERLAHEHDRTRGVEALFNSDSFLALRHMRPCPCGRWFRRSSARASDTRSPSSAALRKSVSSGMNSAARSIWTQCPRRSNCAERSANGAQDAPCPGHDPAPARAANRPRGAGHRRECWPVSASPPSRR
jgi:hypothetical protein